MRLTDYGVAHFRPFSDEVLLERLGRVNIIAGQNNVGKTALLLPLRRLTRVDQRYLPHVPLPGGVARPVGGEWHDMFDERDMHDPSNQPTFRFGLRLEDDDIPRLGRGALGNPTGENVLYAQQLPPPATVCAFEMGSVPSSSAGVSFAHSRALELAAKVVYVPPSRSISLTLDLPDTNAQGERLFTGETLFGNVLQMYVEGRELLAPFEALASDILGAEVQVRASARPLRFEVSVGDEDLRSVGDLGQGVVHALVIAAATTFISKPILLLEEPEQALHPLVQRRLVSALAGSPNVTTLLTTHSNHVLDVEHEHVRRYHLQREPSGRRVIRNVEDTDAALLHDLGVRPSSVLAANAVVWVEGPSDAVYIRAWLKAFGGEKLREHIDLAFVMYGGALLKHFDPGDGARRGANAVHMNWFLVGDRDSGVSDPKLGNPYMRELQARVAPERMWTTRGRTVESYVTDELLCRTHEQTLPVHAPVEVGSEPLVDRLRRLGLPHGGADGRVNKVALAERVVRAADGRWEDLLGLNGDVQRLIAFIEQARSGVVA